MYFVNGCLVGIILGLICINIFFTGISLLILTLVALLVWAWHTERYL